MSRRKNWHEFQTLLKLYDIKSLYHFTDRANLESIIKNGGLYSYATCNHNGITIARSGGNDVSRSIDEMRRLEYYVHLSFIKNHPMMYTAIKEGRITDPIILEVDPAIIYEKNSRFSNMNATRNEAHIGMGLADFERIHFECLKAQNQLDLEIWQRPYYQAEVLIKYFIPLRYITNLESFGVHIETTSYEEEKQVTQINLEELCNGIKDEFMAIYSQDGKRLLKVPERVQHYTIKPNTKIIADNSFEDCKYLETVSIPDSVTHIGDSAFSHCRQLHSISLPDSVISIGDEAFNWCDSMTSISLSQKLTYIGDSAFCGCTSLESIILPQSLTHIGDEAFETCHSLKSIDIPPGVTRIGNREFDGCWDLESVSLPDSLYHIGTDAFASCKSLKTLWVITLYFFANKSNSYR